MIDFASIPKQELLSVPGKVTGDCWRCCVAALVGLPAAEVPHFYQAGEDGLNPESDTQKWLNDRGLILVHTRGKFTFYREWKDDRANLPVISCGPTERSRGLGKHHAVITRGDAVVYDPHPSEAGLTFVAEQFLIAPIP